MGKTYKAVVRLKLTPGKFLEDIQRVLLWFGRIFSRIYMARTKAKKV